MLRLYSMSPLCAMLPAVSGSRLNPAVMDCKRGCQMNKAVIKQNRVIWRQDRLLLSAGREEMGR